MPNDANATEAAALASEPASGNEATNDLTLDTFLEESTPAPVEADAAGEPAKAEPDEYDALKPDSLEAAKEQSVEEGEKGEPEKPAEVDVDGLKLVIPKGVDPDSPELKSFVALAREAKVEPEVAQKLVDFYADRHRKMLGEMAEADQRYRKTLDQRWIRENHGDPEFGGENYDRSCNYVTAALRKFIPKAELMATVAKDGRMGFLEFVNQANIKNNPMMFRFLARVGRHVAEASPITSEAAPGPKNKSTAETLFDDI